MRKENQILIEDSHHSGWIQESQRFRRFYSQNQHGVAQGAAVLGEKVKLQACNQAAFGYFPASAEAENDSDNSRRKEIYGNSK
jgi:hypothetical protein